MRGAPQGARYSIGLDVSANVYGHDRTEQTYTFEDGSTAPMDIVVNNNFYNIILTGRQFLGPEKNSTLCERQGWRFHLRNSIEYL